MVRKLGTRVTFIETSDDAAYWTSEDPITVNSENYNSVNWPFKAGTVVIFGFNSDIVVKFDSNIDDNNEIFLTGSDSPFSVSGVSGLGATEVSYKLQSGASNTEFKVIALK